MMKALELLEGRFDLDQNYWESALHKELFYVLHNLDEYPRQADYFIHYLKNLSKFPAFNPVRHKDQLIKFTLRWVKAIIMEHDEEIPRATQRHVNYFKQEWLKVLKKMEWPEVADIERLLDKSLKSG